MQYDYNTITIMSYSVIAAAATAAAALTYRYFIKSTPTESARGLNYEGDGEDNIYSECPEASFHYDKDHYLANDSFATFIDETISSNKAKHKRELSGFGQFVNIEKPKTQKTN